MSSASPSKASATHRTFKRNYLHIKSSADEAATLAFVLAIISLGLSISEYSEPNPLTSAQHRAFVVFYSLCTFWTAFAFASFWYPLRFFTIPFAALVLCGLLCLVGCIMSLLTNNGNDGRLAGLGLTAAAHLVAAVMIVIGLRKSGQGFWIAKAVVGAAVYLAGGVLFFWYVGYTKALLDALAVSASASPSGSYFDLQNTVIVWPSIASLVALIAGFTVVWMWKQELKNSEQTEPTALNVSSEPESVDDQIKREKLRAMRIENDLKEIELAEKRSKESDSLTTTKLGNSDAPKGKRSK